MIEYFGVFILGWVIGVTFKRGGVALVVGMYTEAKEDLAKAEAALEKAREVNAKAKRLSERAEEVSARAISLAEKCGLYQ